MLKPKILIVEDDFDLGDIIKDHLSSLGCEVEIAEDGLRALEMLQSDTYTCVMSDIRMPVMNGMEMKAKMNELGINTPVIFMTGYSEYSEKQIDEMGGVVLLEKPFNSSKLTELVTGYIDLLETA